MIKLFITDIDGCLTDGGYFSPSIPEISIKVSPPSCDDRDTRLQLTPQFYLRKFNTCDFVGIQMLSNAGIQCVALTGSYEPSMPQFERAGRKIIVCAGVQDKFDFVRSTYVECSDRPGKCSWDEIAFIGDEINDCALLAAVGLSACPADAAREVIAVVENKSDTMIGEGFVMSRKGGELCVREFTDMIRDMQNIKASWCNWEE